MPDGQENKLEWILDKNGNPRFVTQNGGKSWYEIGALALWITEDRAMLQRIADCYRD